MRKAWILAGMTLAAAACTDTKSPLAPTTIAAPAPPPATPSLPTNVPGVLSVNMPIEPGDSANTAFGVAPFGYHGADHAGDGHTGWDIEYRIGGVVRAAAAGTVENVFPDPFTPGRFTVQLEHIIGTHHYRTIYTNLANVNADIAPPEVVRAGQALGTAGTISSTIGTRHLSAYAMTHFQLDDFEYYREIPNPNAVSPEPFLTAEAKPLFDALWAQRGVRPRAGRAVRDQPARSVVPCIANLDASRRQWSGGNSLHQESRTGRRYEYALLAESGTVIETGAVAINVTARPYPLIALTAPTSVRLGLYDIVSNELRLSLANPGSPRASDLNGASVYRTTR